MAREGHAGGVGAVVATAVILAQPAVADQVGRAAVGTVTSGMIKDGTVKPKDLNGKVKKSLARADTATNSVSSGAVVDGSLSLADFADSTGTVVLDFPSIGTGACIPSGTIATGVDLNNAIILVENEASVTGSVQIHARQAQPGFTSFVVIACNLGGAFDPPPATFSWAVLS